MKTLLIIIAAIFVCHGNIQSQTMKKKSPGSISRPDARFVFYQGDLSVLLTSNEPPTYDACLKKFKKQYSVVVNNNQGNTTFSFPVKFELNGLPITFTCPGEISTASGGLIVKDLALNETRTYNGYIVVNELHNPQEPDISLKASIDTILRMPRITYFIKNDYSRENNYSESNTEMPYYDFRETPFDTMNVINMPATGYIKNYITFNQEPAAAVHWGYTCNDTMGINLFIKKQIVFEKAGCTDKGDPFYTMKIGDKYVSLVRESRKIILSSTSDPLYRQWVFVKAPPAYHNGKGFFIYSRFLPLGQLVRLDIINTSNNQCSFNAVVTTRPFNVSQGQVFAIN